MRRDCRTRADGGFRKRGRFRTVPRARNSYSVPPTGRIRKSRAGIAVIFGPKFRDFPRFLGSLSVHAFGYGVVFNNIRFGITARFVRARRLKTGRVLKRVITACARTRRVSLFVFENGNGENQLAFGRWFPGRHFRQSTVTLWTRRDG